MKKLILLLLVIVSTTAQAQFVLFGHAPKDYFKEPTTDQTRRLNGDFLWSLDAVVSGAEITYNKELSIFETKFLSGVGGAIGWKHYKPLPDLTPVSDYGFNLAILTQVRINETIRTGMEIALLVNVYNFTAGPVYIFNEKKIGLLVGGAINF